MSKRFRFSLETLLRVRRLHEREAQRRLAEQQAAIARVDELNRQTHEMIAAEQAALRQRQGATVLEPAGLVQGRAWIAHLRRTIAQRLQERQELVRRCEQLQREYREARKQMRIIEKLRERRWDEHRRARQREQELEMEEVAQQLHQFERPLTDAP
jgi:flagellar FliJ protein